jgi:hypothetical protein
MTYCRVLVAGHAHDLRGAVVSHLAELVRGDLLKAPSSGPSCRRRVFDTTGHLLPKGRRGVGARVSEETQ